MSTTFSPELTIAHRLPHRTRLRWRGAGAPPPELLATLAALPEAQDVEYRGDSRSVILRHSPRLVLGPAPRNIARVDRRPSRSRHRPRPQWLPSDRERTVHVLADLLTVGLVAAWVVDLTMGGAGGAAIPVLVGLLMGLAVYRVWQRRRPGRRAAGEDLMILRAV